MLTKVLTYISIALLALAVVGGAVWFFFYRSSSSIPTPTTGELFGTPPDTSTTVTPPDSTADGTQTIATPSDTSSQQKIFQIAQGPVVGATLIQTLLPTTTIARYISQNDGHVFDMPLDAPGAVPRIVSNVTIPGGARALWLEKGGAALLQYIDGTMIKTVYLGFPSATTSTAVLPTKILFLPDGIADIAASPDGKNVAYLLRSSGGVDGYTAKSDGTGSKKLFSLPLSQVLISWPSSTNLLAQSKSAAGVPGIVFSIDAKTGAVVPLVYAPGITATADSSFSFIIYQTITDEDNSTFSHNIKTNAESLFGPHLLPEKCLWSATVALTVYCATQPAGTPTYYADLWHQGSAGTPDTIYSFNEKNGATKLIALPGSSEGGVQSDILEMALSPDEHYLSFVNKGQRALWGVRLTQ